MTDTYWARRGDGRVWYYLGPRHDAENSQLLTQAEWDEYQNRYERDEDGRRVSGGGRPEGEAEEGYKIETDLSTFDQIERVVYAAGLWSEGILKGTILIIAPVLMIAIATGLTMGIIRIGVRGTERLLPVRRCD